MSTSDKEHLTATVIAGIAVVLLVGVLLGRLARSVRQPAVIGEITAGIILGPSLLGLLPGDLTEWLFPTEARPYLSMIAQVGLLLFMFLVGWELDISLLRRYRAAAASVSLSSIALAFSLGVGLATWLYSRHSVVNGEEISFLAFALYIGVAMSITAFPVLARILVDSGLRGTRVGTLALASAAIDDFLAWCMLAVVVAVVTAGGPLELVTILAWSLVYVAVMALVVRPLVHRLVAAWARAGAASSWLVIVLASGVFLSACATSYIGIHAIFGAFAFGLVVPRQPAALLMQSVRDPMWNVSLLLLPVFFIVTGLSVDITTLGVAGILEFAAILAVACTGKLVGAAVPARLSGLPWKEAGVLGLLMNTRGLTELVILNIGVSLGVLDVAMFTMMVLMALITTAMAGPLLPRHDRSKDAAAPSPAPYPSPVQT